LQGHSQAGSLMLTSVLGTTLARMHWDPSGAWLEQSAGKAGAQQFSSLDDMARSTLGTSLPLAQFFAWARGENVAAPDWEADLSDWPQGRIRAKRTAEPEAELLILLDRP